MAFKFGTVSHGTTGIKTITCSFQPLGAELTVELAPGATNTIYENSVGVTDGVNQNCTSTYIDSSRVRQQRYIDRLYDIYRWNGASYVQETSAALDSFTATEVKYNVTVADSAYQIRYKIWG